MKLLILAAGTGLLAIGAQADALQKTKTLVCDKWRDGVCVSTERVKVKGTPPAFAVGHVFGPSYSYVTVRDLPQPVVTYHRLGPDYRYVYGDGYVYVVDPTTYAVTRVLDIVAD